MGVCSVYTWNALVFWMFYVILVSLTLWQCIINQKSVFICVCVLGYTCALARHQISTRVHTNTRRDRFIPFTWWNKMDYYYIFRIRRRKTTQSDEDVRGSFYATGGIIILNFRTCVWWWNERNEKRFSVLCTHWYYFLS